MCPIKTRQILEGGSPQQKIKEIEEMYGSYRILLFRKAGLIQQYFLKNYRISVLSSMGVKPHMMVYDPFMGIGTTALACLRLSVNYLGTEIDSEYVKVANEDIEKRKKVGAIDDWLEKKDNEILFE